MSPTIFIFFFSQFHPVAQMVQHLICYRPDDQRSCLLPESEKKIVQLMDQEKIPSTKHLKELQELYRSIYTWLNAKKVSIIWGKQHQARNRKKGDAGNFSRCWQKGMRDREGQSTNSSGISSGNLHLWLTY